MKSTWKVGTVGVTVLAAGLALTIVYGKRPPFFSRPGVYDSFLSRGPFASMSFYGFNTREALEIWSEKIFQGRTDYEIRDNGGGDGFLVARSAGTSSALYQKVDIDIAQNPHLVWEWKVVRFPSKKNHEDLGGQDENDFAARVYAIFEGHTVFNSDVIQYVWDDRFVEGEFAQSALSGNVKILVVESGLPPDGEGWVRERRDLVQDYLMLYGRPPTKRLGAVALMSDSDNTRTESEAYFRYIGIERPVTGRESG